MDIHDAQHGRLRNDGTYPRYARLPIIALTANAMLEDRSRCLARASDYVSKPVDSEQLQAQLRMWLSAPAAQAPI